MTMNANTEQTPFEIETLTGQALLPYLSAVADLRIRIFREWPYLYEGDKAYENTYLNRYAQCKRSLFVLARRGETIVGASTAIPLEEDDAVFQEAFKTKGIDPIRVLYFGESIVLPEYRGFGIGGRFFDAREAYARQLGRDIASFCAVVRTLEDPRRPTGYHSPESLWQKRGYQKADGLTTTLAWQEIDQPKDQGESEHLMQFWTKSLA